MVCKKIKRAKKTGCRPPQTVICGEQHPFFLFYDMEAAGLRQDPGCLRYSAAYVNRRHSEYTHRMRIFSIDLWFFREADQLFKLKRRKKMHRFWGKKLKSIVWTILLFYSVLSCPAASQEKVYDMGQIEITGRRQDHQVKVEPEKSTIRLNDYESVGAPQNLGDILKDMVIIDYRGGTELVPDDDTLYMRGFESKRFVTSLNGSTIRKTGGRRGSHIVDYALLPPFLIDSVEILPGPHSALYPGKSIGGVVNFISKMPERYDTLKPDIKVSLNYSTYNTRNHSASVQGGAGDFTYDLGYQKYATNGYLRHNEADYDTVFGRISYILPNNGYLAFTASYADIDRERPVNNAPGDPDSDYDSDYPVVNGEDVSRGGFNYWEDPTWDKIAPSFRLDMELPTYLGKWHARAYYGEEDRDRFVMAKNDKGELIPDSWVTDWRNQGAKVFNEFKLAEGHVTTLGMELEQCYDGDEDTDGGPANKRIENIAGFAQHKWTIIEPLTLTAGVRFTDNTIWVDNTNDDGYDITGPYEGQEKIKRDWSQWLPKSFLTYKLDGISDMLKDTSISAGISKIWRSPDNHGDYNPQGKPTGAWLNSAIL